MSNVAKAYFLQGGEITLSHPEKIIKGTIGLTGSKSESNRALLLQVLSGGIVKIRNLSEADDTRLMLNAIHQLESRNPQSGGRKAGQEEIFLDIGPAGTVMRFMTALLSIRDGHYILTGSARMQQRPISLLVEALQQLGARISYSGQTGFPPLSIQGGFKQITEKVSITGDVSSQYLSALLMIAPSLPKGLQLHIEGSLTSKPYLDMTLRLLEEAGIRHEWQGNTISISPQSFRSATLDVEPDWSAASYWYSMLALAGKGELLLPGLKRNSLQGDQAIAEIMVRFGVYTTFTTAGVLLKKGDIRPDYSLLDFTECPDLAQTVIACAAALKMDLRVKGLHTLRIKETDRIAALQTELARFGAGLTEEDGIFHLRTDQVHFSDGLVFDTYEDHRMAMAFAPLTLVFPKIKIKEPQVVEKSYPKFWVHLQELGFKIEAD